MSEMEFEIKLMKGVSAEVKDGKVIFRYPRKVSASGDLPVELAAIDDHLGYGWLGVTKNHTLRIHRIR